MTLTVSVASDFGSERFVSTSDIVLSCSVVDVAEDMVEDIVDRRQELHATEPSLASLPTNTVFPKFFRADFPRYHRCWGMLPSYDVDNDGQIIPIRRHRQLNRQTDP